MESWLEVVELRAIKIFSRWALARRLLSEQCRVPEELISLESAETVSYLSRNVNKVHFLILVLFKVA